MQVREGVCGEGKVCVRRESVCVCVCVVQNEDIALNEEDGGIMHDERANVQGTSTWAMCMKNRNAGIILCLETDWRLTRSYFSCRKNNRPEPKAKSCEPKPSWKGILEGKDRRK